MYTVSTINTVKYLQKLDFVQYKVQKEAPLPPFQQCPVNIPIAVPTEHTCIVHSTKNPTVHVEGYCQQLGSYNIIQSHDNCKHSCSKNLIDWYQVSESCALLSQFS